MHEFGFAYRLSDNFSFKQIAICMRGWGFSFMLISTAFASGE